MTTLADYRVPRSSPASLQITANLAVVALWSLVGLALSLALALSGYATDIAAILALAG